MRSVLILCTGNSCRSQMTEAFWRNMGRSEWDVASAGVKPTGYVHPLAIEVMKEVGIDIAGHSSKHLDVLSEKSFDLVVTVCDSAKESCPTFPGAPAQLHWPFEDPAAYRGTDDEVRPVFRRVRDEIEARVRKYLRGEE